MIGQNQNTNNLTWIKCNWDPSPSINLEFYLIELIPLVADSVTGNPTPRPELKTTAKTERDLASGNIPTEYTYHNLQPNVSYRVQVAAVDRFGNISTMLTQDIISGGSFAELTNSDITLNPLQTQFNGVAVSWSVNQEVEDKIQSFQVYSDTENFTDLTNDRLKYEGTATQTLIPANSLIYIKLRAIDILGRPSPVFSSSIDATPVETISTAQTDTIPPAA